MNSPHTFRQKLERERDELRSLRVAIRSKLEWFARGHRIGDLTDTLRAVDMLKTQLRRTEKRWGEINHALGVDVGGPPVSLRLTAADQAALARRAARSQGASSRAELGYRTKVMRAE
jgi:hypothetical protein